MEHNPTHTTKSPAGHRGYLETLLGFYYSHRVGNRRRSLVQVHRFCLAIQRDDEACTAFEPVHRLNGSVVGVHNLLGDIEA